MISQAHGRHNNYGRKSGGGAKAIPKPAKFLCNHPNGGAVAKTVMGGSIIEQPVALWYKNGDLWHLNTVVDRKNMPEWAKNYVEGLARKKA